MMSEKIILECKNVTKSFSDKLTVLKGIDLVVHEGDFVSILGESGSGKSTLLCIMGGMDTATTGEVIFEDKDLGGMSEKDLAKLRRTKVGFVFQFFNLSPYLNVRENILLPVFLNGEPVKKYEKNLNELMEYLKIEDFVNKMPSQLSGGEQQRVAIARGLLYKPSIIFLDEPTGNLDARNSEEIMNLLAQINQERKTTIIQVTHSEGNALYGNRIIRISDGKITEEKVIKTEEMSEDSDIDADSSDQTLTSDESKEEIREAQEDKIE